jgi:oxygen-independent coproporphyrinogen III oxidase
LEPTHISAYNLTYEEDTDFLRSLESGTWTQDADQDARFFVTAHELLTGAGFEHYEVSNYARPGFRSLHNQGYWRGEDYLGIGPSAVSTVEGVRSTNSSDTAGYRRQVDWVGHGSCAQEVLTPENRRMEKLGLGLRTDDGIPSDLMEEVRVDELVAEGLAERVGKRVRLTIQGMMVADEIAGYLV